MVSPDGITDVSERLTVAAREAGRLLDDQVLEHLILTIEVQIKFRREIQLSMSKYDRGLNEPLEQWAPDREGILRKDLH